MRVSLTDADVRTILVREGFDFEAQKKGSPNGTDVTHGLLELENGAILYFTYTHSASKFDGWRYTGTSYREVLSMVFKPSPGLLSVRAVFPSAPTQN